MTMSEIELKQEVLKLPLSTRAELIKTLIESVENPSDAELEQLWAAEADRRIAAAERGEMKTYSREEMLVRVKSALS
jgi:putative addiction module component (TIGR02574 family)